MTETYGIFDAADPENPDRVYSAAILMSVVSRFLRDGIVHGDGSGLAVSPTVPAAMTVSVGTGSAIVQGRYYINDDDLVLPIGAANPTYPRIDRVVLRLNITPDRTIHAAIVPGVPAETPEPPALIRTSEIWDISLAQVAVGAGATSIIADNITDERGNSSLCGVAAPQYVPSSQLEVTGPMNMQNNALTGLPAPSGATDAARKGYVDTEIAGAIGGFGISQIAIDADKDWNGKNITNVGAVTANAVGVASPELTVSSNFVDVPGTTLRKTIPFSVQVYTDDQWNTLLSFTIPANYSSNYDSNCRILIARGTSSITSHTVTVRALRDGVEIGSGSAPRNSGTVTINTTGGFRAGDEIVLEGKCAISRDPYYDRYYTLSNCRIQSSRRADLPILAQFVEEGW